MYDGIWCFPGQHKHEPRQPQGSKRKKQTKLRDSIRTAVKLTHTHKHLHLATSSWAITIPRQDTRMVCAGFC